MLSEKKDKMLARVLRLAKIYGPFVRFYPEGSEGKEPEPGDVNADALDGAIKDGEKAARTPEEQSVIDKARLSEQQLEQEKANTTRANEAARQVQGELETSQTEVATLKEQLEAAEAKAAEAGIKDTELDESKYEGSDVAIVKSIKGLNEKIEAKDKRIAALEKKATAYEAQIRKDEALAARNSVYEELLTDLDEEYGTDCRNEAVKKFNELTAAGKVPKGNPVKAARVMQTCYRDAKATKDKAKTEGKDKSSSLSLDSGSGGGESPNLSGFEIPSGLSLDEATERVAAANKK